MQIRTLPAVNAVRYGSLDPLPESLPLHAGPITCLYEAGEIRGLRYGANLFLSRIYAAVRDRNWGTVPAQIQLREQTVLPDRFRLVFDAIHQQRIGQESIDFSWTGTIEGNPDGTIVFDFEGEARSTFLRNRIGFCLLHPAALAGHPVVVEHTDGQKSEVPLPGLVDADQPVSSFYDMRALTTALPSGAKIEIRMEGDIFEMEDQRNWTDASFKTFCTPLSLPYPVEVTAGTTLRQRITVQLEEVSALPAITEKRGGRNEHSATLAAGEAGRLPEIGVGHFRPTPRRALSATEEKLLRMLSPGHLRVDVRFSTEWRKNLAYVADTARRLKIPLTVALFLPDELREQEQALKTFAWDVRQAEVTVARFLLYPEQEAYKGRSWPMPPTDTLKAIAPDAQILVGSDSDFIFFNRFDGPAPAASGVTFQINPQVHAFDNASVMETPLTYEALVETARFKSRHHRVFISPLTLKPRYNAYSPLANAPPIPPDPRQKSLFAAAWMVHCLAALTAAGVEGVTICDAVGDTGLLFGESVYPLWVVLGWLAPVRNERAISLTATEPERAVGLSVGPVTLLANLTSDVLRITFPVTGSLYHIRLLDERTMVSACTEPETFLLRAGEHRTVSSGPLTLELLPYAVACVREL